MSTPQLRVLVVDDNKTAAMAVATLLRREGHEIEVRFDGAAAIEALAAARFDLVLTDLRMEPVDGLAVVRAARAAVPAVDVMVFTAFGSVEAAVEAMRLGAVDFLTKPVTADQIVQRVRRLRPSPQERIELVGDSPTMRRLREHATAMARVRSTVLVQGEPAVGRRHLARWLHHNGLDRDRPLVTVRPGQRVDAETLHHAGTLLISEVDDWTAEAQQRLHHMLEGVEAGQPPRVIATASPRAELRVARGELLPELYFRLAVLVVQIPPLRERPADIEPLLRTYLDANARAFGRPAPSPDQGHLARLRAHAWPGNVRELANLAERAVVLGADAFDRMEVKPATAGVGATLPELAEGFNLASHLEEIERTLLLRAIEQCGGDRPAMGRLLGLERNTLRYKLNKYDLLDRS